MKHKLRQKTSPLWALPILSAVVFFCPQLAAQETDEDYSFDVAEFEKKSFEWGGFTELLGTQFVLDRDAQLFDPRAFGIKDADLAHQLLGRVDLNASAHKEQVKVHLHLRGMASTGDSGFSSEADLFQLNLGIQAHPLFHVQVGKSLLRWGKGYALNPTSFADRPKDPRDPEEALQGFWMAQAQWNRSFDGVLKNLSLTVAVIPVHENVNEDFGRSGYDNLAARVSMLLWDVDVDLMALSGGSRSVRYGIGLAWNLTTNFELHGELAFFPDIPVQTLSSALEMAHESKRAWHSVVGLRYLSQQDTTFILEYYQLSSGVDQQQMERYYRWRESDPLPAEARAAADYYQSPFPMRHYAYFKISQKEPFDWLDFVPSVFGIVNLEDLSFSLTPELLYKGFINLELRLRASWLWGQANSQFGERPQSARIEFRLRYFF